MVCQDALSRIKITVFVDELWRIVYKEEPRDLPGIEIQLGGVMAHVVVQVGKNVVESVITKRSVDEMKLKVGDKVAAVIKSTEVMLEKK